MNSPEVCLFYKQLLIICWTAVYWSSGFSVPFCCIILCSLVYHIEIPEVTVGTSASRAVWHVSTCFHETCLASIDLGPSQRLTVSLLFSGKSILPNNVLSRTISKKSQSFVLSSVISRSNDEWSIFKFAWKYDHLICLISLVWGKCCWNINAISD